MKTNDPQVTVTGTIKNNNSGGEIITFTLRLGLFELAFIVNVPADGETQAPVYIKHKVNFPQMNKEFRPRSNGHHNNYTA